jgi:hypothetical protein
VISASVALGPVNAYSGQYKQKCEQAGKQSQQQCQGATAGANAGDMGQASQIGGSVGGSPTVNPAAGGMISQAMGQVGRLTGATGQCEQAKDKCEQECDQQKQSAQKDQKAQQQGEPQQVDQAKQDSCSQPMGSMIGPLLMALAAAMAALMAAKASEKESDASPIPTATTVETKPEKKDPEAVATGTVNFWNEPAVKKAVVAIQSAGGKVTAKGVALPGAAPQSWSALASGGGGSGASGAGGSAAQAFLEKMNEPGFNPASANAIKDDMSVGSSAGGGFGSDEDRNGYEKSSGGIFDALNNPKSVRGMTINADGTPIGTKNANIFEMISEAYIRKRDKNLLEDGPVPDLWRRPAVRGPASIHKGGR